MIRFLLVSVTGWMAVLGTGIETALPYFLRNTPSRMDAAKLSGRPPKLQTRMWTHYWLGYVLVILVLTHTALVMGPVMGRTDATGIWAATFALSLLFFQVVLGLLLKGGTSNQPQLRRWHFWSMVGFIGLVLIHVLRNG